MPDPFRARKSVDTSRLSPQAAAGVEQRTPANDASVAPSEPPERPGDSDPTQSGPRDGGTSQDVDKDAGESEPESTTTTTTTTTTTSQESPSQPSEQQPRPKSKRGKR